MFVTWRCQQLCSVLRRSRHFSNLLSGTGLKHQYHIAKSLRQGATLKVAYQHNGQHTIRCYISKTNAQKTVCWNCNTPADCKSYILCPECGHLQDVAVEVNYFDLLECPQRFDMELQQLTRQFRQLQSIVHPDKFSNKSEREQINSADWSSLINKAYKTLLTPIERGQYLLQLQGLQIPEDNSTLNKDFLMEMMERNEEIEDATTEIELRQLDERIAKEMNKKTDELIIQFNGNNLKEVMGTLVQMKYLRSMQRNIKSKLQSLIF